MSLEEVKQQTLPSLSAPQNQEGVAQSFKMMDPTALKELLKRGLGPKVNSVM